MLGTTDIDYCPTMSNTNNLVERELPELTPFSPNNIVHLQYFQTATFETCGTSRDVKAEDSHPAGP